MHFEFLNLPKNHNSCSGKLNKDLFLAKLYFNIQIKTFYWNPKYSYPVFLLGCLCYLESIEEDQLINYIFKS